MGIRRQSRTVALLVAALTVGVAVPAQGTRQDQEPVRGAEATSSALPAEDRARGVVYDGLRTGDASCPTELSVPSGGDACVHLDVAPPGIDVREPLSTAEAKRLEGASEDAIIAANELGVATPAEAAAGTDVACDGDGTAGYRVQAMYVVEAGKANRYSDLLPSLEQWAAGIDDVFNRSAALTGGVRRVRWVHGAGSTACKPTILNVTVPAGANSTFNGTLEAVRAMGHTLTNRKYLMWVDATVYCGLGHRYGDTQASQDNVNNGAYAMYARVDQQCWGSNGGHSTEAHELVHTLGGVQNNSPNSTQAGHCQDERDTMCYDDNGPASTMRSVCDDSHEYLLDCNSDDYYSTYPIPGSYLANHWNTANSRFLIGGGDGTNGGHSGSATGTGISVAVNAAVPGLPTQATASLHLPEGRTATVAWRVANAACLVTPTSGTQADITCPAAVTASTTVTATATDDLGATASARATLAFSTATKRSVAVSLAADNETTTYAGCTGAQANLRGSVVDVATGIPVRGITVGFHRRTPTMTAPALVRLALTRTDGNAVAKYPLTGSQELTARTRAVGAFDAATGANAVAVTTAKCTGALTMGTDTTQIYARDAVTVSGTLTRTVNDVTVPVPNQYVSLVRVYPTGSVARIALALTDADGNYRIVVRPTVSVVLQARLAASTSFYHATSGTTEVVAQQPLTVLTGGLQTPTLHYRQLATVTGELQRDAGGTVTPLAGLVAVQVTRTGTTTPVTVARGYADANGRFRVTWPATVSGTVRVVYAGIPGQPAGASDAGGLSVTPWTTATTHRATATSVPHGTALGLSGSVTVTGDGVTGPSVGVLVRIVLTPADGGADVVLASVRTGTGGAFAARVYPTESGSLRAVVAGVTGYTNSESERTSLSVT